MLSYRRETALQGVFFSPPPTLGGLGTTYDVHSGLIGKRVLDFLLVVTINFFRYVLRLRCYGRK